MFYAQILDDESHFDCFIEAETKEELDQTIGEYLKEYPGHSVLFCFEGKILDTIEE